MFDHQASELLASTTEDVKRLSRENRELWNILRSHGLTKICPLCKGDPYDPDTNGICHQCEGGAIVVSENNVQERAIEVMKRYGCYVVPRYEFSSKRIESTPHWIVRTRDGYDMPLSWSLERADRGVFDSPEAALIAAGEYLDSQHKPSEAVRLIQGYLLAILDREETT